MDGAIYVISSPFYQTNYYKIDATNEDLALLMNEFFPILGDLRVLFYQKTKELEIKLTKIYKFLNLIEQMNDSIFGGTDLIEIKKKLNYPSNKELNIKCIDGRIGIYEGDIDLIIRVIKYALEQGTNLLEDVDTNYLIDITKLRLEFS